MRVLVDEPDGSGRAVAGAVAAFYVVGIDDTEVKIDDCMAYLGR